MSTAVLKKLSKEELVDYLIGLQEVSTTLLKVHPPETMLSLIVEKAVDFMKADGGSLYLHKKPGCIDFEACLNKSFSLEFNPTEIPLQTESIATYCFNTGETLNIDDVYLLTAEAPYKFNDSLDKLVNYRTKSTLATPLFDPQGKPIGVLQLFNRKNFQEEAWPKDEMKVLDMPPFGLADIELIKIFADLAASAVGEYVLSGTKKAA